MKNDRSTDGSRMMKPSIPARYGDEIWYMMITRVPMIPCAMAVAWYNRAKLNDMYVPILIIFALYFLLNILWFYTWGVLDQVRFAQVLSQPGKVVSSTLLSIHRSIWPVIGRGGKDVDENHGVLQQCFALLQMFADLVFLTIVCMMSGGLQSYFLIAYLIVITYGSLILDLRSSLRLQFLNVVLPYHARIKSDVRVQVFFTPIIVLVWFLPIVLSPWAKDAFVPGSGDLHENSRIFLFFLLAFGTEVVVNLARQKREAEKDKSVKRFQIISEIRRNAISTVHPDELLSRSVQHIYNILEPDHTSILVADLENNQVFVKAQAGRFLVANEYRQSITRGIVGEVLSSGESLLVNNVRNHPYYKDVYIPVHEDSNSELCVPIQAEEGILGVINVESEEKYAFDLNDKQMLETIAKRIADSRDKARLKKELDKVSAWKEISKAMAQQTSTPLSLTMMWLEDLKEEHILAEESFDKAKEQLQKIQFALTRLTSLDEEPVPKYQDKVNLKLTTVLNNIVREFPVAQAEKRILVEFQKGAEDIYVAVYFARLYLGLKTAITDALQFCARRERVKITVSRDVGEDKVATRISGFRMPAGLTREQWVPGIDAGLSYLIGLDQRLVKEIIEKYHDGELHAKTEDGAVVAFEINLPIARLS